MWRALITACLVLPLSLFSFGVVAKDRSASSIKWSMGVGFEGQLNQEVNPRYTSLGPSFQVFQIVQSGRWAGVLEAGLSRAAKSSDGALVIENQTIKTGAWGRYKFDEPHAWSPFVSMGAALLFDQVRSSFRQESDSRKGVRGLFGAGVGLSKVYWKHLHLDGEGRVALVRDRKDPVLSVILRAGVQL